MIIEIRKAGFINKGAELMLYTILEQMGKIFPEAEFAMAPQKNKGYPDYQNRAKLGILQKVAIGNEYSFRNQFAAFIPKKIRESYGLVVNNQVDVVLDAAGFAYSDQWGDKKTRDLARYSTQLKKHNSKLILLPQAFGPFTTSNIIKDINCIADNSDLIYARDQESYEHLINAAGNRENIKIAPDFTNSINGIIPDYFDSEEMKFCIIPNHRMLDKTDSKSQNAYLPFVTESINYLISKGIKPFFLIHEGNKDLALAEKIQSQISPKLAIITESHPLKIKGILGACEGSIGSRFHGLVSALSQGTPSLGAGWSHKYRMLFDDYGFNEGIVNINASKNEIHAKIDLITDKEKKQNLSKKILANSLRLKKETETLWQEIEDILKTSI